MNIVYTDEWREILKELDALGDLSDNDLSFLPEDVILGAQTEY